VPTTAHGPRTRHGYGVAFSADGSVLYVNDTRRRHIRVFDLQPNGTLARQTDRVFVDLGGPEPGDLDGMKVDSAGNVYCGGSGALYIIDPKGKKLGRIVHGFQNTANVAFGGDDWKTVYFCTRASLGSFTVNVAGVPVPASKRTDRSRSVAPIEAGWLKRRHPGHIPPSFAVGGDRCCPTTGRRG
jgi:hypothetical protein